MSERETVVELPFAAYCCPCVEKLRTVLPLPVGIRDGVVPLVSMLGGAVMMHQGCAMHGAWCMMEVRCMVHDARWMEVGAGAAAGQGQAAGAHRERKRERRPASPPARARTLQVIEITGWMVVSAYNDSLVLCELDD
jgi:hypothetical protein